MFLCCAAYDNKYILVLLECSETTSQSTRDIGSTTQELGGDPAVDRAATTGQTDATDLTVDVDQSGRQEVLNNAVMTRLCR